MNRIKVSTLILSIVCLVGCTGPMGYRQAKLPDGAEIRAYHATALFSPSVTVVALRPAGSTNWTIPNTFSGPGLVPGAATGGGIAVAGALLRPSHAPSSSSSANAEGGDGGNAAASSSSSAASASAGKLHNHPNNHGR